VATAPADLELEEFALDEPAEAARAAGLRYVSDAQPGIRRRRQGRGFAYVGLSGEPVRERPTLKRIRSLAVPPAWTDVWICADPRGHLQATGRDARGRKQYRYHPRWREVRDEAKYGRLLAFGESLPALRRRVERDLGKDGLPRERIVATVVRLLDRCLLRIGNLEYAKDNGSFGLTTLRDDHVAVEGSRLRFKFRGKSGKEHDVDVRDRRIAQIVRRCQELPGQELFRYEEEDGGVRTVESDDVNLYLGEATGQPFTAKDFRTWAGTVLAARELAAIGTFGSETEGRRNLVSAIKAVAEQLGNTQAVCRKCYVHPAVVEAYLDGSLLATWQEDLAGDERGAERAVRDLLKARS